MRRQLFLVEQGYVYEAMSIPWLKNRDGSRTRLALLRKGRYQASDDHTINGSRNDCRA